MIQKIDSVTVGLLFGEDFVTAMTSFSAESLTLKCFCALLLQAERRVLIPKFGLVCFHRTDFQR